VSGGTLELPKLLLVGEGGKKRKKLKRSEKGHHEETFNTPAGHFTIYGKQSGRRLGGRKWSKGDRKNEAEKAITSRGPTVQEGNSARLEQMMKGGIWVSRGGMEKVGHR